MDSLKISEYNPDKPAYGPRLTDQEWEYFKPMLDDLDIQGIGRREIVEIAAERHGFRGTYAAMNTRFKKWGLTTIRNNNAMNVTATILNCEKLPSTDVPGHIHDGGPSHDDDNETKSSAMLVEASTTALSEALNSQSNYALNELIPSTSNLSVENATSTDAKRVDADNLSQNIKFDMFFEAEGMPEGMTASLDQPALVVSSDDDDDEEASDAEEIDHNVAETDVKPLLCLPKRSHSQVSSLASCEFGFGRSSQTQSFMHLAKRLRHHRPTHTPVSWSSKFSWESLGRSEDFAAVTGFESTLMSVFEEAHGGKNTTKQASLADMNETNTATSETDFLFDSTPPPSRARPPVICMSDRTTSRDIPDAEFTKWQEMDLAMIRRSRINMRLNRPEFQIIPRSMFPVVNGPDILRLSQRYPSSQAVLCRFESTQDLYYLIDRHSVTGPEKAPLLNECRVYLDQAEVRKRKTVKDSVRVLHENAWSLISFSDARCLQLEDTEEDSQTFRRNKLLKEGASLDPEL